MQKFIKLVAVGAAPALALQEMQYLQAEGNPPPAEVTAEKDPAPIAPAEETDPAKGDAPKESERQKGADDLKKLQKIEPAEKKAHQGQCSKAGGADKHWFGQMSKLAPDSVKNCFYAGMFKYYSKCEALVRGVAEGDCVSDDLMFTATDGTKTHCCAWQEIETKFYTCESNTPAETDNESYKASWNTNCADTKCGSIKSDNSELLAESDKKMCTDAKYFHRYLVRNDCCKLKEETDQTKIANERAGKKPDTHEHTPPKDEDEEQKKKREAAEQAEKEKERKQKEQQDKEHRDKKDADTKTPDKTPTKCCTCQTAWIVVLVIAGVSLIAAGGYMICAKPADDDEEEEEDSEEEETRTSQRSGSHRSMRSGN